MIDKTEVAIAVISRHAKQMTEAITRSRWDARFGENSWDASPNGDPDKAYSRAAFRTSAERDLNEAIKALNLYAPNQETDRWDLWWYCDGTEEVYYEKPDDCGHPGSYRRHDACRWVRLVDATPAEVEAAELSEAAQDWAEDAYDRDYEVGERDT